MSTKAVASASGSSSSSSSSQVKSKKQLSTDDFINMMVTQLQHQDPMNPTSNQDLLQQMNAIGQLQSSNTLQTSLQSMVLQNQIGSAGNLIGKSVKGTNDQDKDVSGIVNSVRIESNQVYLELDNGSKLQLGRVTSIAASTAAASATQAGAKVAA